MTLPLAIQQNFLDRVLELECINFDLRQTVKEVADLLAARAHKKGLELQALRILIVDDNATNRDILHHRLESWGVRNNSAPGGTHTLQLLYKAMVWHDPFDLAILDMHMPEMDGIKLAKPIKADEALAST